MNEIDAIVSGSTLLKLSGLKLIRHTCITYKAGKKRTFPL